MSGAGISTRQEDKSGSVSSLYGLSEYQASLARRARVEQRAKENHIAHEEEKKVQSATIYTYALPGGVGPIHQCC
jgi:hypothetical protein